MIISWCDDDDDDLAVMMFDNEEDEDDAFKLMATAPAASVITSECRVKGSAERILQLMIPGM